MSLRLVWSCLALLAACSPGGPAAAVEVRHDPGFRDAALAMQHPFFPLRPGTEWTYAGESDGVDVREHVRVLEAFEVIARTQCVVVQQDRYHGERLDETTLHFYAGDFAGRLWLFGEESFDAEGRRGPDSWRAERELQPIAWLPRTPVVGERYLLPLPRGDEWTDVVGLGAVTVVPGGAFTDCLVTFEGTEDDGDLVLYAPGVGRVRESAADGQLELVDRR